MMQLIDVNILLHSFLDKKENYVKEKKCSSDFFFGSSFNWDFCLYCQAFTKESLRCPGSLTRQGHDPVAIYEKIANNIERFQQLNQLRIVLQFTELDTKAVLIEKFINNTAKFHKTCTSKFSALKLERAEK